MDLKKVTLFKDAVVKFLDNNGMDLLPLVDLHLMAKKNVAEISFGTQNFFKTTIWQRLLDKRGVQQ